MKTVNPTLKNYKVIDRATGETILNAKNIRFTYRHGNTVELISNAGENTSFSVDSVEIEKY